MSLEVLSNILYWAVGMPLLFAWVFLGAQQRSAVHRSKERYVLTTWAIIITALVVINLLCVAAIDLLRGEPFQAGVDTILAFWYAWLSRHLLDDDNWFNQQFKKLKRGLKNLGERLSSLASPLPSPA